MQQEELKPYAVQGVEFTYLKVADMTTHSEGGTVNVLYGFDSSSAVLTAIGVTAAARPICIQ